MALNLDKLSKEQLIEKIEKLNSAANTSDITGSAEDLLHELQVHQIELEMKNRELRDSQKMLEEARDRYADLYDFSPLSYISLDDAGRIQNINLVGAEVLGQPRANIINQPFSRWVARESLSVFFNHLHNTLQSDGRSSDEIIIRDKADRAINIRIESSRSRTSEKEVYVCQSVLIDITEQKRSKKEISLKARQLKLITDVLPVQIAYINYNSEFEFVNKLVSDWLGLPAMNIVGKKISDVWHQDNKKIFQKNITLALSGKKLKFNMELPINKREKSYLSATLIPDVDEDGRVNGVVVMIGDITDRLQLESIDRQRLLDAAHYNRLNTMGEMASEIAHELNQPLAAISIYSDACKRLIESKHTYTEKITQSLAGITKQAERASDVIKRIRSFVSKKELSQYSVDINEIVQEAMQLLEVELRTHQVKLTVNLAVNVPPVKLDRILIEQVILNLSRNAIEAMDEVNEQERELKITTFYGKISEVEVNVEDTGPGISNQQIKQIFEPFHTTRQKGMGMGLTISQSIIEAHQGHLWAVENNRRGTIFSFTLPLSE